MGEFSRTWWGNKFIAAIESFTDSARLGRGRSYARGGKILEFYVNKGKIEGLIRGSVNPYFGVYTEPRYQTEVEIKPIATKNWAQIIKSLSSNASFVSKLLLNEVPDNIEDSFLAVNQRLLPSNSKDFKTSCSCPDYSNPCKHIAGLCYRFAAELDEDPFLLFELRGLPKEKLYQELAKTPLGKALLAGLGTEKPTPVPVTSYYTELETISVEAKISLKDFWQGQKRHQPKLVENSGASISGIIVKKQGDFPPFWHKANSFIATMEELYERVRTKNKDVL